MNKNLDSGVKFTEEMKGMFNEVVKDIKECLTTQGNLRGHFGKFPKGRELGVCGWG